MLDFWIARGSVLECASIQDALVTTEGIKVQDDAASDRGDANSAGDEIR